MDKEDLQELEGRLKEVICAVCTDRGVGGTCNLQIVKECPMILHLPRLVEVVRSVHSPLMEDYVEKVRQDICSICENSWSDGVECDVRSENHCAMDSYLLPIVQIIDDFLTGKAQAEKFQISR